MKTIRNILSCAILLAGTLACSLEETPEHFVDSTRFYETEAQCRSSLNSCYDKLNAIFNYRMFYMTELQSDLWYNTNGTDYNATLDITPSSPGHGESVWTNCYIAIMYCNECIECIGASQLEESVKMPLVAEARVLRALYYHILTQVFNGVPFYDYRVDSIETMEEIRRLPRTEARVIREMLYDDIKENALPYFTKENGLRDTYHNVGNQRAGYALGLYLMANFAMWNECYDDALHPLMDLEEIYEDLTEENYPLRETLWSISNTPESIFELQHSWSETGVQYYGNFARVMTPAWSSGKDADGKTVSLYGGVSLKEGFLYETDGYGREINFLSFADNMATTMVIHCTKRMIRGTFSITREGDGTYKATPGKVAKGTLFYPLPVKVDMKSIKEAPGGGYTYETVVDMDAVRSGIAFEGTEHEAPVDRRTLYTIGIGNLKTGETFDDVRIQGRPYAGPKFWCPTMVQGYDSNNYKIYRYADAVLLLSECYAGMGDLTNGVRYLNKTRLRAVGSADKNPATIEELMQEIKDERARELAGEMHRKFDLVRWGDWYDVVKQHNEKSKTIVANMRECHRYYPIPDTECALSGYVLKNEEY